jgi:hypothetical protein
LQDSGGLLDVTLSGCMQVLASYHSLQEFKHDLRFRITCNCCRNLC